MHKLSKLLNTLIKYTTAAVLVAVPLYPKFPFIRVPGIFVAIRLEDLLLAFSGLLLILIFFFRLNEFLKDKLVHSIALFLTIGLVSLISGIFLTQTIMAHIGFLHWTRRIEYFVPLFLGFEAVRRERRNLEFYFKILLIVVFLAFVYGLGQKHFGWPIIITQNEEYSKGIALRYVPGSHINSTFAGHYDLATFLVLILPVIIVGLFILKGVWTKFILAATAFSALWLLVNTASRVSVVSYLFAVTLALILVRKFKVIPLVLIVSILFVGFSSNLLARYGRLFEVGRERLQQFYQINYQNENFLVYAQENIPLKRREITPTAVPVERVEDRSTNIRLNVEWPRALRAFSKNPLLGTGYSSITLATDNDYLRLLGEVGILGFFAFWLIFAQIFLRILKLFPFHKNLKDKEQVLVAGVVGALPGIFTNAFFIDVFEASKFATIFWLFMGFVLGLARHD